MYKQRMIEKKSHQDNIASKKYLEQQLNVGIPIFDNVRLLIRLSVNILKVRHVWYYTNDFSKYNCTIFPSTSLKEWVLCKLHYSFTNYLEFNTNIVHPCIIVLVYNYFKQKKIRNSFNKSIVFFWGGERKTHSTE